MKPGSQKLCPCSLSHSSDLHKAFVLISATVVSASLEACSQGRDSPPGDIVRVLLNFNLCHLLLQLVLRLYFCPHLPSTHSRHPFLLLFWWHAQWVSQTLVWLSFSYPFTGTAG